VTHAEAWYEGGMLVVPWRVACLLFSGPRGVHATVHHEVRQQRLVEELYAPHSGGAGAGGRGRGGRGGGCCERRQRPLEPVQPLWL